MSRKYLPPLRFHWLTRFYDPLMDRLFDDRRRKTRFVTALGLRTNERLLDVGCGTARLAAVLAAHPAGPTMIGLDRDLGSVLQAARTLDRLALSAHLVVGDAACLPFPAASFDRVTSTLVFHHLSTPRKRAALTEVRRVLAAPGNFLLLDFGRASNPLSRAAFAGVRLFDGWKATAANASGELPGMMKEAGFARVEEEYVEDTRFGTLRCYSGTRRQVAAGPGTPLGEEAQKVSVTPK